MSSSERAMVVLIQEEGSTVVLFDYDARVGRLTTRQTISTLLPGYRRGAIFVPRFSFRPMGRFLYAGNRLHDSIAIFSVGPTASLSTWGKNGREGIIRGVSASTPRGGSSIAATSGADNIAVFRWIGRMAV